ncbi:hypothetical protein AX16_004718 [Volvariella volvacea WC 439]|nr:hypothetical protein AX16_004718 [Volvariella volvacea WC 439]
MTPGDTSTQGSGIISFNEAPLEIIRCVAAYLDTPALKQLRLTSRYMNAVASPLTLRSVAITFAWGRNIEALLESCKYPLPGLYQNARNLTIWFCGWFVSNYIDRRMEDLCATIERCTGVRSLSVKWRVYGNSSRTLWCAQTQGWVADAVLKGTNGKLEELEIESSTSVRIPPSFLQLKQLRVFKFTLDEEGWWCNSFGLGEEVNTDMGNADNHCIREGCRNALLAIIRSNSQLKELYIVQGCGLGFHDIGVLFPGVSDDSDGGGPMGLHAFTIKGVKFPRSLDPCRSPFIGLQHLRVLSPYSLLPLDNLWTSLQAAGTTLKTLTTSQTSHPLILYLASYSGLQELVLLEIEDQPDCISPRSIALFFEVAIPQHATSLGKLSISFQRGIDHLDGWSFTPSLWMPALQSLKALKSLHLSPGSCDTTPFDSHTLPYNSINQEQNALSIYRSYQEILDSIFQLKGIQNVEIFWTRSGIQDSNRALVREAAKQLRGRNEAPPVLVLLRESYYLKRIEGKGSNVWGYVPNI